MAESKTAFVSYVCMGLMLISHVYHGRLQVEAACPSTADCDECTTEQTACRLCPYDTNIPAGVIDLTILPGMVCPAITRMGLLRDAQFTTLTDIERLTLAGVGLKLTYGQVFKNSPKLKYLSLAHNEISTIDDQILQRIPALEYLDISYNNIASVDPNAFSGLTHLQTVDLSNNALTTINAADFNGVTIGTLDLSNNPITQIEDGAFAGSTIATLDLSGTQISNVPPSLEQWLKNGSTTVKMDSVSNFDCNCDNSWFAMSITGNGPSCSGSSNYPTLPYGVIATQVMRDCTTTCPNPPECDTCDPLQATCSICPDDPRIPATLKDFTVVQGTCTTTLRSNGQIRDSAFTRYPDLENLNLDDADIMVFVGSVFKNNGNLRTLSMSNGRIRSFPMTLLQNLNKLEDLNVSNNNLLGLVPTVFQGLSSLRTLDLSKNSLAELTNINVANIVGDVFGGLGQLTTLILDSNPITNIDSDIFQPLTSVETISLQNMQLADIKTKLFAGLSTLKEIRLTNNNISSIADDSFVGTSLDLLDISNNELTSVPTTAIQQSQTPPKVIDLSDNEISKISAQDFTGVTIDELDLSGNPLTAIEDGAFSGSTISVLKLNGTGLTTLPPSMDTLLNSGPLQSIYLDNNQDYQCSCDVLTLGRFLLSSPGSTSPMCSSSTKYIGQTLTAAMPQLEVECMKTTVAPCPNPPECDTCDPLQATCSICPDDPRIPATLKDFTVVQGGTCTTTLRSNGILKDPAFTRYTDLENLNLDDADIVLFIGNVFKNNGNLRTLSMSNGRIRSFSTTLLQNLNKLEELNLSNNNLMGLVPTNFQGLSSLRTLDLSRNSLPYLTNINPVNIVGDIFGGLGQLTTLILDSNPITNIDSDIFQPLTSVETISLQNMQLADIKTKLFAGLSTLKEIRLSNNRISSIADDSFVGISLDLLDISHNDLNSVPSLALKQSGSFQTLDMSYNNISQISAQDFSGVTADKLDLSGNPISMVEDAAFDNSQITQLDLNSTDLTSLPSSMERWLINSQVALNLDSNTGWECTCDALWLGRYLSTSTSSKTPTCGARSAYAGKTLVGALPQMEQDCLTTATTTINKALMTTNRYLHLQFG